MVQISIEASVHMTEEIENLSATGALKLGILNKNIIVCEQSLKHH
jgi:hypothetical protein